MERIDASARGRVEVAGRWFGVRGRRFVRPTLTLSQRGAEVRALADLEHKPWAAEDGEVWMAAFSVKKGLDGAREIELSVAPDIVVELRPKGKKLAKPGDTLAAAPAAHAGARTAAHAGAGTAASAGAETATQPLASPRRRLSPSAELERLGARLAAADHALEEERERRAALARTLEEERTVIRQLRTELGQARVELEVAAAARAEATAVEEELDATRRELRETQRRHEADTEALTRRHEEATQGLTRDREQEIETRGALRDELQQHTGALEATREALAAERAEAGRLRSRLAQAQEARQRGATPADAPGATPADAPGATPAAARGATPAERQEPDPTETRPFDVLALDDGLHTVTSPPPPSRPAPRRSGHQTLEDPGWNPPTAERLRPLNPSLRHRTWWFGRLLALIVLCGVIAAVWMVLHSTVLH